MQKVFRRKSETLPLFESLLCPSWHFLQEMWTVNSMLKLDNFNDFGKVNIRS